MKVKHIDQGINPLSYKKLFFSGKYFMEGIRIGGIAGMVALTVSHICIYLSKNSLIFCILIRAAPNYVKIIFFFQEAVAIARTFAAMKDYQIDGNKEMIALGTMNVAGSLTSCYIATGKLRKH